MFLADASTKRPVAMSCLLIALTVLGLNAYRKMSVESLPKIDIPYITISTTWVGATPGDIETDVTKHIEDAVSGLDGLKHIESQCMENMSLVILEFNIDVDVDVAAVDVREKIDGILQDLPSECERPVIEKDDINATAVATLALIGEATLEEKYDYVDDILGDKFSSLPGVAKVDIIGGNEREVHVELDRQTLASAGLTSADVVSALQNNVGSVPAGTVKDGGREFSVKYDSEYSTVEAISSLEVVNKDGVRRYLRDLGTVRMTTEEMREKAFYNGQPAILMKVVKKAEGNTVKVVNEVRKRMQQVQDSLPGGMHLEWVRDDGRHIQASVDNTLADIIGGIILCGIILLLFLGNIRTTLLVCITMPLTVVVSFFGMGLLNYTLNNSTLLAIGLSVGILVSNSIVVLENVVKRFQDTPDRWEAARVGTSEVAVAVIASAGTNVVVMLPIGMMTVMVGKFFSPFALTTLIVNIASIFISFTLTPILCALLLRPDDPNAKLSPLARFGRWWQGRLKALGDKYKQMMGYLADHKLASLLVILGALILLLHAFSFADTLGFTFFDPADRGEIFVKLEFPVDYNLERTTQRVLAIEQKLLKFDGIINSVVATGKVDSFGGDATQAVYLGQIQLRFQDKMDRPWTIFERMKEIENVLKDETDCIITVAVQSELGGMQTPVQLEIHGDDLAMLDDVGTKVKQIVANVPGTASVDSSVRDGKPQLLVTPNRPVLSDRGMPTTAVGTILRGNLEGIEAATFKTGARSFDIRVKFKEEFGKDQVPAFQVPGNGGNPVSVEAVANLVETRIPVSISRMDKQRVVDVTSTLDADARLQLVLDKIMADVEEANVLPSGYTIREAGDGEMMEESVGAFLEAIILAILLTYLTLSAILESFVRPFLILFTLPLGLIGVLWGLRLGNYGISIFVLLGTLMLIGVVVNAAVVIIDRMSQLQRAGKGRRESMVLALGDTFRAVLMLVMASSLGMLPMALGRGLGSEMRAGIGTASFGGVLVSGILTMLVLPLIYTLFTKKKQE